MRRPPVSTQKRSSKQREKVAAPQGRRARRRHLDGKGNAVEPCADRADRLGIGGRRREGGIGRHGARGEELRGVRLGQRAKAKHAFALDAQRLLRARQQLDARRMPHDELGERRHSLDEVLAIVEHKQRTPMLQPVEQFAYRVDGIRQLDAEHAGDRAGN